MSSLHPKNIDKDAFQAILERYDALVPERLSDLETFRLKELPKILETRRENNKGSTWMEKDELVKLVEWKLKHGTFRPKLLQLVSSNPADEIKSLTKSGFDTYSNSSEPDKPALVNQLAKLKGVGPATASLILGTFDSETTIFFGDEVFRWLAWDEPAKGSKGWPRQIAYTAKEYRRLDELATDLRKRLDVQAIDIEKVGYVLGKEAADLDSSIESREKNEVDEPAPKKPAGGKRKMESTAPEAKGRKSRRVASS